MAPVRIYSCSNAMIGVVLMPLYVIVAGNKYLHDF